MIMDGIDEVYAAVGPNAVVQGPDLHEGMKDQIRDWFNKEKEEQGKFPDYPSDEEGGSNLIFNPDLVHNLLMQPEGFFSHQISSF